MMINRLTAAQQSKYDEFKDFVREMVCPDTAAWEASQCMPREILRVCGERGFIGGLLPSGYGGGDWDTVTFGLLNEAFGSASASLTGFFTVQSMVAMSLLKWGTAAQCHKWLPAISAGEAIASFALTEPEGGSNIRFLNTSFTPFNGGFLLNGKKKWITFSGYADVLLVFGQLQGEQPIACLVEKDTPGLTIIPVTGMMGFRASHLSEITFDNCFVPLENMVAKPGFGISCVANQGLHYGRISTACSAAGLFRSCLEESVQFSRRRMAKGSPVANIGEIRSQIARMATRLEAVQLMCWHACSLEDMQHPDAIHTTLMAKLTASVDAVWAASQAVLIHGAAGCHEDSPVSRCYRDAKIMEIIEGTTQVCENIVADTVLKNLSPKQPVYE
ncbi:acyl-CoA dehydrogenase family protein [Chitinophaga qingshengii]|uniref:Acyl-CoA/acyl-ACP dehydrogenase n=1 Tax=Chitinophaga qingshengii TaxID=1569794 RepID=A0ABR7TIC4_9BACT|nr:acyl-CoA dehydrogenase family protein [Chitinophaga qingshengii]MBC9929263.1 acyl-CoA/acyl-ACP dehydrogenase [Chitinophaga qingshengii]